MTKISKINSVTDAQKLRKTQSNSNKLNTIFSFNREIEPTKQAKGSISCWLLSGVNALNTTKWGKETIKNAIHPEEAKGRVKIHLEGSPIKQKDFYVSYEEMYKAQQSGRYCSGDLDMLAIEIAVEKLFKYMETNKIGNNKYYGDENNPSYLGNMWLDNDSYQLTVEELITGRRPINFTDNTHGVKPFKGISSKDFDKVYKYLAQNNGKFAITVSFSSRPDFLNYRDKNDLVHGGHAYCVKNMVYGKYVILSDPFEAEKDIKISWQRFTSDEGLELFCSTENDEESAKLENQLPKNYRKSEAEFRKEIIRFNQEQEQKRIDEENQRKKEEFEQEQKYAWERIVNTFGEDGNEKLNDFNPSAPPIDKHNVIKFFNKYGTKINAQIDKQVSGWGYGAAKKTYILPMINALAEVAKNKGISQAQIDQFKKICIDQELDALIYTNEKVIIQEVQKMLSLIKN